MADQTLNSVVLGRRIWRGVSWRERRRIIDAVKHDELLRDPAVAEKVVEVVGRIRRKKRRPGLLLLFTVLVVVALEVARVVADVGRGPLLIPLLIAVAMIGSKAWEYVEARRWWDRWMRAEVRHLEYLQKLGAPAWRFPEN